MSSFISTPVHWLDWIILFAALIGMVAYGVWRGGRVKNLEGYMLADRETPWYRVGLSIMATQASAITFLSTTGQGFTDGMRFVQFYLGLPLAMIVLCVTAVPLFHRLKVFTAYEYLETRFDWQTRALTAALFLIQRGLSTGLTLYAPALVLSLMLGWPVWLSTTVIGVAVLVYTFVGGAKAVGHSHLLQMAIIWAGMFAALGVALYLLPQGMGLGETLEYAGHLGRMNALKTGISSEGIDWNDRYTLLSGLLGGFFLQLSYFGTDQSQVQRYLTAKNTTESRLGLIFNGLIKIPMQVFILLVGVVVFVLFQFQPTPLYYHPEPQAQVLANAATAPAYRRLEARHDSLDLRRTVLSTTLAAAIQSNQATETAAIRADLLAVEAQDKAVREEAKELMTQARNGVAPPSDNDFIFARYILNYLPIGLVGLLVAVIFAASMSSCSGALSALTSCTIVDVWIRWRGHASPAQEVRASRISTLVWGLACIVMAGFAGRLGNLIEAVNILGSLFYGTILGIFLVAFYNKTIGGRAVFWAAVLTEAVVVWCWWALPISYLWYNVIGAVLVPAIAWLLHQALPRKPQLANSL